MSMYITAFIRTKDDKFIPIFSRSRSTSFYEAASPYAPWEKIRAASKNDLAEIRLTLENEKTNAEKLVDRLHEEIKTIQGMNNTVEDKMEYINDHLNLIDEEKTDIDYLIYDIARVLVLEEMIDENCASPYTENENARPEDEIIYLGTEVGYNVTIDDIA